MSSINDKITSLKEEIANYTANSGEELENFRMKFISRKSEVTNLFAALKDAPADQRKELGLALNDLKNAAQDKFQELIQALKSQASEQSEADFDLTLPPVPDKMGTIHPLTQVTNRIVEIFERIGFNIVDGPEIEDDWHNFSALNFPENHPAREMQDTFFLERDPDILLRTHTSSVQIRLLENQEPPVRSIMPGRVYRNETISSRAHCMFHQIEGIYIDKGVSFADLKQTLLYFAKEFFGKDTTIRLRPSYFPFTEPSAELDIYWGLESEADYRITKGTGWLELGGCGMVDPNVLKSCNIDPEEYTGFAFGVGVERIAMNKYQIDDLRLFTENDVRFLKQFASL